MWTGAVKKTVTVRPGETLDVPLRAEALAKGVFVLKDYKLTWSNEESGRGVSKVGASAAGVQRAVRGRGEIASFGVYNKE